jgi:hypothetical protein
VDLYWLEQSEADVPAHNDWLSVRERAFLDTIRFAKRRGDWRLGRWAAKRALAVCTNTRAQHLERPKSLSLTKRRKWLFH